MQNQAFPTTDENIQKNAEKSEVSKNPKTIFPGTGD